jgi:hypothetical protein
MSTDSVLAILMIALIVVINLLHSRIITLEHDVKELKEKDKV